MSVLAYPTDPTRLDYTLTPWTDTLTGKQWLWVEGKERWHQVPQWPDQVFTTSSATPTDQLLPWFDPEDGSYSVWNATAGWQRRWSFRRDRWWVYRRTSLLKRRRPSPWQEARPCTC